MSRKEIKSLVTKYDYLTKPVVIWCKCNELETVFVFVKAMVIRGHFEKSGVEGRMDLDEVVDDIYRMSKLDPKFELKVEELK